MSNTDNTPGAVDAYLKDQESQRLAQGARIGLALGGSANPDLEAELARVARATGVPVDTVRANPEPLKLRARLEATDFTQLARKFPRTAAFLSDVNNAKVAHDDVQNLGVVESVLRAGVATAKYLTSAPGTKNNLMGDIQAGYHDVSAGFSGVFRAAAETPAPLLDWMEASTPEQFAGWRGSIGGNPLRRLAEGFTRIAQDQKAKGDAASPKQDGVFANGVSSGVRSFVGNTMMLPMALLPGGQASALFAMSAQQGGQSYQDAREKNVPVGTALPFALSQGVIEFATEKLPVSRLIGDLATNAPLRKVLMYQMAAEIPGEQVATVLQDLNEWAILNPEKPFSSYLEERPSAAAQTLIATMIGVGGNVAVMRTLDNALVQGEQRSQRADAAAQMFEQLGKVAQATATLTRDPDTFQAFVKQAAEGGEVKDVFIDANALMQSGMAEQVAAASPSVAEQLPQALATGGTVRIPVDEYMARIAGTELNQSLVDHLKVDPEDMSRAEAKAYMQSDAAQAVRAEVERVAAEKQADDTFKASSEAVKAKMLQDLNAVGRFTPEVNETYATLVSSFYSVLGAKLGITPEAAAQRFPLFTTAEGAGGAQVLQQAMQQAMQQGGLRLWHGSADPTWIDRGEAFDPTKTVNAPSKYQFLTPRLDVAETYAGISEMQRWKAENGMGAAPSPTAGVREFVLPKKAKLLKIKDVRKAAAKLGVEWAGDNPLEVLLDAAKAQGYDAVQMEMDGGNVAVLNPSMLMRATQQLNQSSGDERDLIVTHNLTEANLMHALKMGGLAVPSLAITKRDTPLTNFGEITLIGPPEMADPKGYASTKVFGADIYSPRYPNVERELDRKAVSALEKLIAPMAERMGESGRFDPSDLERRGQETLERSLPVMATFLKAQGIEPEIVMRKGMDDARRARLEKFGLGEFMGVTSTYELTGNEAFRAAALAEARDAYAAAGKREGLLKSIDTDERFQDNIVRGMAQVIVNDAKLRKNPEADRYPTQEAMEKQLADANLGEAFRSFVQGQLQGITKSERIYQGYTNGGNRKYTPHTLENVVKILKKELRGGENFNYGVGSLRAKFTPQFKSVAQIKKEKGRLVSAEQFDAIKKEIDDDFLKVAAAIDPGLSLDTASAILEDAAKMGVKPAAKSYGHEISDEAAQQAAEFLTRLRNLPTAYFEAKILRDVSLSEFKAAVVPEGTSDAALKALRDAGITDIRTYAKNDEAGRAAAIKGAVDQGGLLFQNKAAANRGMFNPATSTITLLKGADLSTFLHEAGHFFLEVQFRVTEELRAQAAEGMSLSEGELSLLRDSERLLQWFGVESMGEWHSLDFEEMRHYHEQFARGFESYLFEGKAPSVELQRIFQRFRAWLLNVYRDLLKSVKASTSDPAPDGIGKAMRVELSDEVRAVFDRMLATNEDIRAAELGRSMIALFSNSEQMGVSPEEFRKLHELGVDATNDAIQSLQARTLRDLAWTRNARGREIKRLQREAKDKRAEVEMEARREVMSQPVYRAWQFLTSKIRPEDKLTPEQAPKSNPNVVDATIDSLHTAIAKLGGLNKDEVVRAWGLDPKDKTSSGVFGKPVLRREGGRSIDSMVEVLVEQGYLPADENGKGDVRDLEERFQTELRGDKVYSIQHDYSRAQPEARPGDGLNVAALASGRFDLAALRDLALSPEVFNRIKDLKMTAKDGLHPDIVAEMFEFSSGDELVRSIAAAQDPKSEIEALADLRMLERYGELATPEAIAQSADIAIHNEARARFIATEANALATAAGKPKVLLNAAKAFARETIARLKVRDIKPSQYTAAETRAGKAAAKASGEGNVEQAAVEKRNQLINNALARSALEARDEVDAGLKYLKRFESEGSRKGLDADYLDQIDALLERFDLRSGQSLKAIDKRAALAEWVAAQREMGLEPDIPPELLNEAARKSYKDMTVQELRGLIDTVRQIEHLGRLKKRLLTAKDQREYEAIRDEVAGSIVSNAGDRTADTRTPTTNMGRMIQGLKRFWASHIKAATLARVMDGGKDGGPVWEYIIRPANERGDMETRMRAEATTRLSEILAPVFKLGKMGGKGQFFPSINRSLNREARIAIALNMGNEGNIQRLLGGEGWNITQVMPVLQSLSATEWQAVQAVWDHLESYRPEIAAKERRVYGKEPDWVEPRPLEVTTADGQQFTLRGGYYPIKYDPQASQRAEEHADAEGAKRQLQGAYTSATTRRSFAKSRVEEVAGRPLLYTLSGLYSGVNDVIHDLAWHEWLIDANRLMRSKTIDSAIRNHYGPEAKAQFKSWIADIAEGDQGAANAGEAALSRLRQGVSVAGLGFNVMSAVMQPLGLTQSIVRVGAPWVGRGIARYVSNPMRAMREVNEMSEFMASRSRTRFRELNELRNRVQDETAAKRFMSEGAYYLMMRCQQMVDVPTWWGAYEKAIAAGNDDERAVSLADQAVIDAQGGGQTKDLAAIERGGPALKLFTVFYSFMNTALNLGVAQTMSANTPAKKGKLAADMLLLYVLPPVLGYILKQALTPGDDDLDDPEKLAKQLLAAQLDYLMGMMVVVREFGEAAKLLTGANDKGRDYQGPAGLRVIADTGTFAKQAQQGEMDDSFRKASINLLGGAAGLPAAQINRTITGVQALSEGKTTNPAAVAFGYQEKK